MSQSKSFDSDVAWDFLSDLLDDFCSTWEQAPPTPEFDQYADRLLEIEDAEFRRVGLIELIKVEFEFRSSNPDSWRPLKWYMQRWTKFGFEGLPPELINEERRLGPDAENASQLPSLMQDFQTDLTQTWGMRRARELHKFQPGDSIDDFDLLARLGRGAFATVFLARQVSMQRLVALKISADEGHEGPTLAKLTHPHIVRVFDQRVIPEKSLRLMYMEYVPGGTLADVIKHAKVEGTPPNSKMFLKVLDEHLAGAGNSPPIESPNRDWLQDADWPRVVARIGAQLADAIEYTHGEGVLHRDIKPANVLLDEHGHPKLVDFNISYGNQVIGATAASFFGGSLAYMSPEQLEAFHPQHQRKASEIDGSADVYSLGVTLYELLMVTPPFASVSEKEPIAMIDAMLAARQCGMEKQTVNELKAKDHLLGMAIGGSLQPNAASRTSISTLQKQFQWASDEQTVEYLKPVINASTFDLRGAICQFPWLFILAIVFGVSLFSTWYVIAYNVTESVRPQDQHLFLEARQMINRIMYPIGLVLLISLFWKTWRMLRSDGKTFSEWQLKSTIESNLNFGHTTAVMFASIWTISGMLFPIVLTIKGAELPVKAWLDFSASHFMVGLICGAFVFFGLTLLSVTSWHPRLVMSALQQGKIFDVGQTVAKIRSRVYWYRVIAIGTPLVAIATLVNFRTSNSLAPSILSVAAIVGLAAMARAIRDIGKALDLLERS